MTCLTVLKTSCISQRKLLYFLLIILLCSYFLWLLTSQNKPVYIVAENNTSVVNSIAVIENLKTPKNWTHYTPVIENNAVSKTSGVNWIVVTTIKYPSQDIEKLSKIDGWQVLVVGDLKTPKNWTFPGCIFLGIDEQKSLGLRSVSNLPTNSYTRKMVGYLYAIQHGAKFIYDTDDDNHPNGGNINFNQDEFTRGLIYDYVTDDVMNPYAHFGQPSIWPRGFPLDLINKPNNNTYKLCTFKTPAIQQGLVNGDPDVDAIFRLTRKEPHQSYINVTFDARAPPVTLPEGVFAPFNSQNTFFHYNAFWALFLPTTVAFRVTDIWRGYWAQRLLWLIGQRLSFFPPNAVQFRNSHDYLDDFIDENQFYTQTNAFITFLKNWTCSATTFFECVSHLGNKMVEGGFWAKSDAELLNMWLSDLVDIGYRQPEMNNVKEECLTSKHEEGIRRIFFSTVVQNSQNQQSGLHDINRFCGNQFNISSMENTAQCRINPTMVFENVLLIIVFNNPFYRNIHMLDALYYDHFPNMVYCGQTDSYARLTHDINQGPFPWRQRQVTFINITSAHGYFSYECAIRAMEMRYNVESYLVLADDIMFNIWNFEKIRNLNMVQLQVDSYRTVNRFGININFDWWYSMVGKKPLEKAFNQLDMMAHKNFDKIKPNLISTYMKNRYDANLNMSVVAFCVSDLYFIPKSVSDIFLQVMKVFLKNQVFLEIAVPNTLNGLNLNVSLNGFVGKRIFEAERNTPLKYFDVNNHYVHPVKFTQLFHEKETRKEYCQKYVTELFKHW